MFVYNKLHIPREEPPLSVLIDLFKTCARELSAVAVILDAFDECDVDERGRIVSELLPPLSESGVKVYITTRHHLLDPLKLEFESSTFLEIKANKDDIENYLMQQIKHRWNRLPPDFKMEITRTISERADGMYKIYSDTQLTCLGFYSQNSMSTTSSKRNQNGA
jgi:hypothetical protein